MRRRRCAHAHVRCLHGDEINWRTPWWATDAYRAACTTCGKALPIGLPAVCTVTGKPHA